MTKTKARLSPLREKNPETGREQWYDRETGHWLPDPYVPPPRPTADEMAHIVGADRVTPSALLAVELPPFDALADLPLFIPDPAKVELRARHAARLATIEREVPGLRDQVERGEELLERARVRQLNGRQADVAQEQGDLAEAEANLRRPEQESRTLRAAIVALDAEMETEHRDQHRVRRWALEARLRQLAGRQLALLRAAVRVQEVAAELARIRHGLLEPDEQRMIGAIHAEWTYTDPHPLLDQLEAALSQDQIPFEPGA